MLLGLQNSPFQSLGRKNRCVWWRAMCYIMNMGYFHSQFGLWLFSFGFYNQPIKLPLTPCMRLLSWAELSWYLLFHTFIMPVVLGNELSVIKILNLSMDVSYYTHLFSSSGQFFLFEILWHYNQYHKIRQICQNTKEFQCLFPHVLFQV